MRGTVAIVGGGIVGLCSAEALHRKGFDVTVIDSDSEGQGCSYGNGGIIVPSHFVPIASPGMIRKGMAMMIDRTSPFGFARTPTLEMIAWVAKFLRAANRRQVDQAAPLLRDMNLASRDLYEELIGRLGVEVGYARTGCLMLCKTEEAFREEVELSEKATSLGLQVKMMRGADLVQTEPGLMLSVFGGVHFQDDAHLTPPVFMKAMKEYLQAQGVKFLAATVSGFKASGDRIEAVRADGNEVEADQFVLAAGAWSGRLAAELGLKLPLLSGRGYGFTVPSLREQPTVASILVEARVAVTPMLDGTRLVGALELGPPEPGTSPGRIAGMRRDIPEYYPTFNTAFDRRLNSPDPIWHGHRPCSPDGLPYLGRPQKVKNLIVATGHAMMGMSLGPITGALVAQVAEGETPSIGIDLLSPDRYR